MDHPRPPAHRLIDTEAGGLALGVTARRIRQLVAEGKLTNHGTTRRILLDVDELTRRKFGIMATRARAMRASRADYPDTPEQAAEQAVIARALAPGQTAAITSDTPSG